MFDVSVIIPNYNSSHFVAGAIRSVLNQTYRPHEIIVVDDGSTDNCHEVVATFGVQVRYIYQENQGLAGARNTGIHAARGDLIGLLDADDEWLPQYLERMLAQEDDYPNAIAYYCQARCMDADGFDLPQVLGGPPISPEDLYWKLLRANFIIPSTVILRRAPVIAAGLFDPNLRSCEDWDLWLRFLSNNRIIGMGETLVRYRIHGSSLSTHPSGMQAATKAVIEKHFGIDDGHPETWTKEKRRAYGGVYRYHLLTSIQRQNDWKIGVKYLRRGLVTDPTLSIDVDLFYELALGSQPPGFRGSVHRLNLVENVSHILALLQNVFSSSAAQGLMSIRKQTYGTAYFALGLLAYNIGEMSLSRKCLLQALNYRPDLWRNHLVMGNLVKSLLPKTIVARAKSYLGRS